MQYMTGWKIENSLLKFFHMILFAFKRKIDYFAIVAPSNKCKKISFNYGI